MRVFVLPPIFLWICLVLILAMCFGFVFASGDSPEKILPGSWKETEWMYEKVEHNKKGKSDYKSISESIKQEIVEALVIHEAETWKFNNDGTLELLGSVTKEPPLHWKMKGRGNILVLSHVDGREEHYNINRLTNEEIVIHFESDIQARGIVKIVLKRLNCDVDRK